MWHIYIKEINSFFNSLVAYIVMAIFLVSMGLIVWVFPESNVLTYGYAEMSAFFYYAPYILMFMVPAINMRMFAEEQKAGTLELLYTSPLKVTDIVIGKYLAGFTLMALTILPTIIYYYSIYQLGDPIGNIDTAGVIGSYIGLLLLGAVFTGFGVLTSSFTDNQIVAFILAVFFSFFFHTGLSSIANINVWSDLSLFIEFLSLSYHYDSLSRGLIDSRDVIYLVSLIILSIYSTTHILERSKS